MTEEERHEQDEWLEERKWKRHVRLMLMWATLVVVAFFAAYYLIFNN